MNTRRAKRGARTKTPRKGAKKKIPMRKPVLNTSELGSNHVLRRIRKPNPAIYSSEFDTSTGKASVLNTRNTPGEHTKRKNRTELNKKPKPPIICVESEGTPDDASDTGNLEGEEGSSSPILRRKKPKPFISPQEKITPNSDKVSRNTRKTNASDNSEVETRSNSTVLRRNRNPKPSVSSEGDKITPSSDNVSSKTGKPNASDHISEGETGVNFTGTVLTRNRKPKPSVSSLEDKITPSSDKIARKTGKQNASDNSEEETQTNSVLRRNRKPKPSVSSQGDKITPSSDKVSSKTGKPNASNHISEGVTEVNFTGTVLTRNRKPKPSVSSQEDKITQNSDKITRKTRKTNASDNSEAETETNSTEVRVKNTNSKSLVTETNNKVPVRVSGRTRKPIDSNSSREGKESTVLRKGTRNSRPRRDVMSSRNTRKTDASTSEEEIGTDDSIVVSSDTISDEEKVKGKSLHVILHKLQPEVVYKSKSPHAVSPKPEKTHTNKFKTDPKLQKIGSSSPLVQKNIKPKPPVWATFCRPKTPGRKSMRLSGDAYAFSCSPTKKQAKKRKPRPYIKKDRPKPRTKLRMLTTDPNFESGFPKMFPRRQQESHVDNNDSGVGSQPLSGTKQINASDSTDDEVFVVSESSQHLTGKSSGRQNRPGMQPQAKQSINSTADMSESDHSDVETGIDTHDNEDVYEGFEGETASSFVVPQPPQKTSPVPMTSVNVMPTPAVPKHIAKFLGGSSTPRFESTVLSHTHIPEVKIPKTVQEDIDICFGFDSEPETEADLSISPVKLSAMQYSLEISGSSDLTDFAPRPTQIPSRFYYGRNVSLNSNTSQHSNISSVSDTSRARVPLSVIQKNTLHKRTVQRMAANKRDATMEKTRVLPQKNQDKTTSQPNITKRSDCTTKDSNSTVSAPTAQRRPRQTKTSCTRSQKRQDASCATGAKDCDLSVLFDDEEEIEKLNEKNKSDERVAPSRLTHSQEEDEKILGSLSPEKSFSAGPRKSYNRQELEEARKKFIKEHAGFATDTETETETETESEQEEEEEEEEPFKRPVKRKKTTEAKAPTKKIKKTNDKKSATSKDKKTKKTKKEVSFEKSVAEWASHLNSHFSDVEDTFLVVT